MEVDNKTFSAFLTGHWNTYAVDEIDKEVEFTRSKIYRELDVFANSFQIKKNSFALEELLCLVLDLEELPKKNLKRRRRRGKNKEIKLKSYRFKLAFSPDDALLFCHRTITDNFKEYFIKLFHGESLTPVDLSGSPPLDLLQMYRDGIDAKATFDVYKDNYIMDCVDLNKTVNNNEVFTQLGSSTQSLPKIRKLSSLLKNVSFSKKDDDFKDIVMKDVNIEMHAPSIFELYQGLAEENLITSVPDWVEACRQYGRTHRNIIYKK